MRYADSEMRNEGELRPWEDVSDVERARLSRARKLTGRKLHALLPSWLRARPTMPERFKPDFSVSLPSLADLGIKQTDPRIAYSFPGGQLGKVRHENRGELRHRDDDALRAHTEVIAEYIAAFCKLNNLVESRAAKPRARRKGRS